MAFSVVWDVTVPTGSEAISNGDNRIRDFKVSVQERMQIDHSWAPDANDGKHIGVTLRPVADATPITTEAPNTLGGSTAGGLINVAQTWNTSGICTAVKVNITNTASDATSVLFDLQIAGTSKFKVDLTGNIPTGPTFKTPAFNAGDYTGSGSMTVTVSGGNVTTSRYCVIGKAMTWQLCISGFTLGGVADIFVKIKIPGGFVAANTSGFVGFGGNASNNLAMNTTFTAGSNQIQVERLDANPWDISGGLNVINTTLTFEVQ